MSLWEFKKKKRKKALINLKYFHDSAVIYQHPILKKIKNHSDPLFKKSNLTEKSNKCFGVQNRRSRFSSGDKWLSCFFFSLVSNEHDCLMWACKPEHKRKDVQNLICCVWGPQKSSAVQTETLHTLMSSLSLRRVIGTWLSSSVGLLRPNPWSMTSVLTPGISPCHLHIHAQQTSSVLKAMGAHV